MTLPVKRAYTGKDVDMLTACATIIGHAIDNSAFLITKRPTWADPFLTDLKTRIENAFPDLLGIDNAQAMRQATQVVTGMQAKALIELAEFKVQIDVDFKADKVRRAEILTSLGFTAHYNAAKKKDQEALVELLVKFKVNMTPVLFAEITAEGMAPDLITAISDHAVLLNNANITQETLKGSRKTLSASVVNELNSIYNDVIRVARISAKFFKNDPAMRDKFSYSKTRAAMNNTSSTTATPTPTDPTPVPPSPAP